MVGVILTNSGYLLHENSMRFDEMFKRQHSIAYEAVTRYNAIEAYLRGYYFCPDEDSAWR